MSPAQRDTRVDFSEKPCRCAGCWVDGHWLWYNCLVSCNIQRHVILEDSHGFLEQLLTDIDALEEDLLAFERKYGVRSETFYAAYQNGEEPEDDLWMLDLAMG